MAYLRSSIWLILNETAKGYWLVVYLLYPSKNLGKSILTIIPNTWKIENVPNQPGYFDFLRPPELINRV